MPVGKFRGFAAALLSVCLLVAGLGEAQALKPRGTWSASVSYALDDIVILRGSTWRSKHNANQGKLPGQTSPTSTAADWELLASGFNPLGAWKSTATYQKNDLVRAPDGAVYRALRTNANKTPGVPATTADWQIFVLRGAQGPQGVPGSTAVGNGSTTAPAFKFTSSPDTGMFSPGDGKVALAANGALFLHDIGFDNLGLGSSALNTATTGQGNVALGLLALTANTSGSRNVAVGRTVLTNNTTGSSNTVVGDLAMQVNVSGSRNTAVGDRALLFNREASDNTAVGFQALQDNKASGNTAVGSLALANNTTGIQNTALGLSALGANTTGKENTAVGFEALQVSTTALGNTAIGRNALRLNNADNNTAVGHGALEINATGDANVALGRFALSFNTSGSRNVALGKDALVDNQTGSGNIALGDGAGSGPDNPQDSIFIGNSGENADTATIKIGAQGTQHSTFIAGIRGETTGANDAVAVLIDSSGQLGTVSSSRRYKEDIQPMGAMSDMLARLRPVTFRYIKPYADGSKPIQYGLIAEEVAEVFPHLAVFNDKDQPETVKYHELPAFLLEGFQEQQKIIAAQSERIATLEARLAAIEAMLQPPTITAASAAR